MVQGLRLRDLGVVWGSGCARRSLRWPKGDEAEWSDSWIGSGGRLMPIRRGFVGD